MKSDSSASIELKHDTDRINRFYSVLIVVIKNLMILIEI